MTSPQCLATVAQLCAFTCLATAADLPATRPGSPLSVALQVKPAESKAGERVRLTVTLRNVSNADLVVRVQRVARVGLVGDQPLQLLVIDGRGRAVAIMTHNISAIPPMVRELTLKPGGDVPLEFDLFSILPPWTGAGQLHIQATYSHQDVSVESNSLPFKVLEPSSDEKQAAQLYEQAIRAGSRAAAIEKLELIARNYSETPVIRFAREEFAERVYLEQPEKSIAMWRQILASKDANDTIRWQLAEALAERGKLSEAIDVLSSVDEDEARKRILSWKAMNRNPGTTAPPATHSK